jgi:outer membrane protein assembly factor BamB
MDGGLYVLDAHTGKLAHRFAARAGFYSTPAISGDLAVIGSLDKNIYCYNLSTSRVAWEYETNGRVFASPVIDDTDVFIGSNDGRLYQFDLISGSLRSSLQFTERIVNAIALGRDHIGKRILFVPTHAGELFRMEENAPN